MKEIPGDRDHARQSTITDKIALSVLAREGIAVIWQLQVAAADAYRSGHPRCAEAIVEIAEAAEAARLRAESAGAVAV